MSRDAATDACEARAGERGQAMLLALLALLLASIAAAFVGEDLLWRQRALQEESARAHVRAMLDGALAAALARLDAGIPVDTDPVRWQSAAEAITTTKVEPDAGDSSLVQVTVEASYDGRRGAVVAQVRTTPQVRVLQWGLAPVETR